MSTVLGFWNASFPWFRIASERISSQITLSRRLSIHCFRYLLHGNNKFYFRYSQDELLHTWSFDSVPNALCPPRFWSDTLLCRISNRSFRPGKCPEPYPNPYKKRNPYCQFRTKKKSGGRVTKSSTPAGHFRRRFNSCHLSLVPCPGETVAGKSKRLIFTQSATSKFHS